MSSYSNELLMLIFQSTLCKQVLIFFAYSGLYYLVTYFMDKKIQHQQRFLLKLGLIKLQKRNKTKWEKIRWRMQLCLIVSILVLVVSTFVLNPDDQYILFVIYIMKFAVLTSFAIAFVDSLGPIKEIQQLTVSAQSNDALDNEKKLLTITVLKK